MPNRPYRCLTLRSTPVDSAQLAEAAAPRVRLSSSTPSRKYQWEALGTPEPSSTAARRMWYDTVGHGHPPASRCAADPFGADRLLLGTDFPYEAGDVLVRAVDYISDSGLDPDDPHAI